MLVVGFGIACHGEGLTSCRLTVGEDRCMIPFHKRSDAILYRIGVEVECGLTWIEAIVKFIGIGTGRIRIARYGLANRTVIGRYAPRWTWQIRDITVVAIHTAVEALSVTSCAFHRQSALTTTITHITSFWTFTTHTVPVPSAVV